MSFADIVSIRSVIPKLPHPPLSSFRGYLKRIDNDKFTESQKIVFGLAAPHFSERLVFRNELDVLRAFIYGGKKRKFDQVTPLHKYSARRYAGGDDLGRGRYYTLTKNADGDDGGTLRCELFAYQAPYWSGMTLVEDSECLDKFLPEGNFKQVLSEFPKSVLVCLFNTEDAPHRFFGQIGPTLIQFDRMQRDPSGNVTGLIFALPYEVKHHEIENVLDLRERPAQEWLVRLAKDGKIPLSYEANKISSLSDNHTFFDLLRYLVSPINGGGMVTDFIGAFLRHLAVSGLVYPSARYDGSAQYKNNRLIDFDGWNFLDLRSAEMNSGLVAFDYEQYELPIMDFLQTTDFEISGVRKGSWQRTGVTAVYADIYAEDLDRITSETKAEREFRLQDYFNYWKTIRLLGDPEFHSYLTECMAACGMQGIPEDISPRMWQYVLNEVSVDFKIPKLRHAKGSIIPLDLRLIGN